MAGRTAIAIEVGVLCALALLAIFWIIPAQTEPGGIGLDPADMPTACAIVIALLVAGDGAFRLLAPAKAKPATTEPAAPARPAWLGAAPLTILICIAAAVAIQFVSVTIMAAVIIPLLMLVLGERGPLRIALTTAVTTLVLAFALGWRG